MKLLTVNNVIQSNASNLITEIINDELAVMDFLQGNYILFNKIGRIIWEEISSPIRICDLIELLLKRFDIDDETCTKETLILLNKLNKQAILVVIE